MTNQMPIATGTGHLFDQPLALRKAVIATPPTIDTANSSSMAGSASIHGRKRTQKGRNKSGIDQFQKENTLFTNRKRFHDRSSTGRLFR